MIGALALTLTLVVIEVFFDTWDEACSERREEKEEVSDEPGRCFASSLFL